jgi:hypothetical protein
LLQADCFALEDVTGLSYSVFLGHQHYLLGICGSALFKLGQFPLPLEDGLLDGLNLWRIIITRCLGRTPKNYAFQLSGHRGGILMVESILLFVIEVAFGKGSIGLGLTSVSWRGKDVGVVRHCPPFVLL